MFGAGCLDSGAPASPYACQYLGDISGDIITDATGVWPLTKNANITTGNRADSHGNFILTSNGSAQAVSVADFTPLKSANYFELEVDVIRNGSNTGGTVVMYRPSSGGSPNFELYYQMATNLVKVYMYPWGVTAQTPAEIYFNIWVWKHIKIVFDGLGATNADRLKMYIDGSQVTLSFSGTVPAAMSSSICGLYLGDNEGWGHGAPVNAGVDNLTIKITRP